MFIDHHVVFAFAVMMIVLLEASMTTFVTRIARENAECCGHIFPEHSRLFHKYVSNDAVWHLQLQLRETHRRCFHTYTRYSGIPEGYAPVEDVSVVRRKKFPMPPISIEDATLCLDYLDHDFYVFRNSETKEINVVYRRAEGGVGLIEPEQA